MSHTITLGREGLAIDANPLYLLAGQLHYFRYPQAEWRDLLLKARAGGLNTIDTVIPWNFHEPNEGEYNFVEDADLGAFFDLCAELGLWVIARPGPYICAEWENGGFPAWFTAKDGIELRLDNPVFLEHTMRWFDRLFAILTPRQAIHGGAIILCQTENEHWASGRYGHDMHQQTLAEAAIARGMAVPQYTCMGATPGYAEFRNGWTGIAEKLVATRALWPENPMIVSELWSGWFDSWGASRRTHKQAVRFDTVLNQLTAVGASGFSHWMWAGGTNFGPWGGRTVGGDSIHMTTSYDYAAPVSEYGELTAKFYTARRHHLLLGTLGAQLAPVLAAAVAGGPKVIAPAAVAGRGDAGSAPYRNVRSGPNAPAAWRDFTATFVQNTIPEGIVNQLYLADGTHLAVEAEANTIKPIFTNLPLGGNEETSAWLLAYHTSRILGFWPGETTDTLVLYGFAGEVGRLAVRSGRGEGETAATNSPALKRREEVSLDYWVTERPSVTKFEIGGRSLNIVLLTTERADRFWPLRDGSFLCGPALVTEDQGERQIDGGPGSMRPLYTLAADGTLEWLEIAPVAVPLFSPLELTWSRHAVAEASETAGWREISAPQSLEELGTPYGYGWYRTTLHSAADTTLALAAPWLSDRARLLLDGVDVGWLGTHPRGPRLALELPLAAGQHDLRLLLDNLGRFNYGSNTGERKGLFDNLYIGTQHDITKGWTALWQEASFAGEAIANAKPWAVRADAQDIDLASFAFQGATVWLLRAFEAQPGMRYLLHVTGDRSSGGLFVNGTSIARFSRHYLGGFIKADISDLLQTGTNVIALNIQQYAGVAYHAHLLEYDPAQPIGAAWQFRAGVNSGRGAEGWELGPKRAGNRPALQRRNAAASAAIAQRFSAGNTAPAFFKAAFAYDSAKHGPGPFKFYPLGLRKGQIWLNGRDVGRYWQIGPQEAYKLPASWLEPQNELLVFDEEGGDPNDAWIGA